MMTSVVMACDTSSPVDPSRRFCYSSIETDRQGVRCIQAIFQPFHEGEGFCIAAEFNAPGVHLDHPAFGRARFFNPDQHQ